MNFDRYTERARQVVILARDEARSDRSPTVDSLHLLMGLLREEEGLAARVLHSFHVTLEDVRSGSEPGDPSPEDDDEYFSCELLFSTENQKALDNALREALSLGHNYIGTEHILLGILRTECEAHWALLDLSDRTEDEIRNEIIRVLSGPRRQAPAEQREVEIEGVAFTVTPDDHIEHAKFHETLASAVDDDVLVGLYELRDAVLKAIGWMAADDHYMAYETLVGAIRPYTD